MAIVQAVIVGITMLSDIGLVPCIVQNKRGGDREFLDTAWSIQLVRGGVLWGVLFVIASPISNFYNQPQLTELIPAAGLVALIAGFNSTKLATADRKLEASIVTMIDVGSYAAGLLVSLIFAWLYPSVWALVWGSVLGAMIKMVASHYLLAGDTNRLCWDRGSARVLFGFGQWIFVSSLITFLAGEGSKLLVGSMLGIEQLAFFTLASTMNVMVIQACQQLGARVLFPSYAEILRERPERLSEALIKARLVLIVPSWLSALFFTFFGSSLMGILYDQRYSDSGYMLEILAVGSLASALTLSYAGVLLAKGKVTASTAIQSSQVLIQFAAMSVGHSYFGVKGVVAGLAVANWLSYFVVTAYFARVSLWHCRVDLPFIVMSLVAVIIAI